MNGQRAALRGALCGQVAEHMALRAPALEECGESTSVPRSRQRTHLDTAGRPHAPSCVFVPLACGPQILDWVVSMPSISLT
jgi:hypothetical protein